MFSRILVATDLSRASDEVICTLASLKALGTREALLLECLNVRDVGGLAGSLAEQMKPKLEQQRERVARQGLHAEAKVVAGLPHIEINRQVLLSKHTRFYFGQQPPPWRILAARIASDASSRTSLKQCPKHSRSFL